ncbi:MAG: hypothetical protein IJ546_00670 [Prevotella sp.]|nr:hypothetical protein [Prevotella sp.]
MKTNYKELEAWCEDARSGLSHEIERLREREQVMAEYMQAMDATYELMREVEDLTGQLEEKQEEIDSLNEELERKEGEIDHLRQKLLEAENQQLEKEKEQLEKEVSTKPAEIHNHFGKGSTAQVFNDKVTGKFLKMKKTWKIREKRQEKKRKA